MAGHLLVNSMNWPSDRGHSGRRFVSVVYAATTATAHSPTSPASRGSDRRTVGLGVSAADFDNDRRADLLNHRARGAIVCSQPRRIALCRRDRGPPVSAIRAFNERRLVRLRP
jgi:hypothetical protein